MIFNIGFENEVHIDRETETTSRKGVITIGSFREGFLSLQSFWSAAKYEDHWRSAIRRILSSEVTSCLITSIADPSQTELLFWWPMYREGNHVYLQNGILLFAQLLSRFDPHDPFASVPPRTMIDDDGRRVLEWKLRVRDLEEFLGRHRLDRD